MPPLSALIFSTLLGHFMVFEKSLHSYNPVLLHLHPAGHLSTLIPLLVIDIVVSAHLANHLCESTSSILILFGSLDG